MNTISPRRTSVKHQHVRRASNVFFATGPARATVPRQECAADSTTNRSAARRGVSLSEVLVSLLVLSIGVVPIATLFPLSVLRSIQATQLTNGTQLRYNYEGLVGAKPELHDGAPKWQANTPYSPGDLVVPTTASSYVYECISVNTSSMSPPGLSDASEPAWKPNPASTTTDFEVVWQARPARVFMVDPLGWLERNIELQNPGATPGVANVRNTFGRLDLASPASAALRPLNSPQRILRLAGITPTSLNLINSPCVLPDSWELQHDTVDLANFNPSSAPTSVQIINNVSHMVETMDLDADGTVDLTGMESAIACRITFFDITGQFSITRPVTTITSPSTGVEQYVWVDGLTAPPGVTWVRARVETFDARYSWILAGRRQPSGAISSSLIVFFRRSFAPEDELIHNAHFLAGISNGNRSPGADETIDSDDIADLELNLLGGLSPVYAAGADGTIGTIDDNAAKPLVVIEYNPAIGSGSPFLKRGGYICDAQNNRWYRILSYDEISDANAALTILDGDRSGLLGANRGAIVRLETPIMDNSGAYTTNGLGGAILMRSIVEVFPLPTKLPWEQ